MKRVREYLGQCFAPFRKLPPGDVEPSWNRVLQRFREEPETLAEDVSVDSESIRPSTGWRRSAFVTRRSRFIVATAVLIATVAIGLVAAQRSGLLPAMLPAKRPAPPQLPPVSQGAAVAVNPAPERTTIEAFGSKEPVAVSASRQALSAAATEATPPQNTDAGAARLQFAAASVRPGRPMREQPPTPVRCKGVDGEVETGFGPIPASDPNSPPQGRCTGENVPLIIMVATAYGITDGARIIGLPFIDEQPTYQIRSAAENPSRTTKAELRQMLQNLLMDRFNAKVHRETREMEGFALTVAKSGIKFKVASGDEEVPSMRSPQGMRLTPPSVTGLSGGSIPIMVKGRYRMNTFVPFLEELLGLMPVADKTNLPGLYDVTLTFDLIQPTPGSVGGRGGQRGQGRGGPEMSPPLNKGLEDQLGLHLEPGKVPAEFLVVDHIEKPSEN